MDGVLRAIKDAGAASGGRAPRAERRRPGADRLGSDRPLPRFFVPADPVFLLEGAGRSYKHGFDDLHSESGNLACRLSGHTVTSLSPSTLAEGAGGAVRGEDLLARGLDHGGVPPECEDLLRELALLDPGSAETAAAVRGRAGHWIAAAALQVNAQVYAVEQTAWWIARDDRRDARAAARATPGSPGPCRRRSPSPCRWPRGSRCTWTGRSTSRRDRPGRLGPGGGRLRRGGRDARPHRTPRRCAP